MSPQHWDIVKLTLSTIASLLHSVGFIILWKVKQKNPYLATQRLYLLSLSIAENYHSVSAIIQYIGSLSGNTTVLKSGFLCAGGGSFLWYSFILIMLTIDRFCTVYFNLRYLTLWSIEKTKVVLAICFVVTFIANIVFFVTLDDFDQALEFFAIYVWAPTDNLFILLAIVTYSYTVIFCIK